MNYSPEVAARFAEPAGAGPLPAGLGIRIAGEAGSADSGTWVVFEGRVEGGQLAALVFRVFGCPHSIAACSLAAERLKGRPVADLAALAPEDLATALEIPVEKTGRLLIIQDALRNCLADWDNARLGTRS